MEKNIWEGVKPFKKIEKGSNNRIGYGFILKRREPHEKLRKRKWYRRIRKYGFDITETWNLDYTIMRYLSDNFGGYFRMVGNSDDWLVYCEGEEFKENLKLEESRYEDYKNHLHDLIENMSSEEYSKFSEFVIPRLEYLKKKHSGYPGFFNTDEVWIEIISRMIENLRGPEFIEYFFHLWD